uniref:hypothetical protein n=1 Tax=Carnobacterium sp. PL26RED25 TaxID=2592352 RepID=UPI00196B4B87|nr:hypothetical protein [Carnobacterium sp. PL26RED25]
MWLLPSTSTSRGKTLDDFAYLVGELANSVVVVLNEQSHPGRVIVAHKKTRE